METTQVLRTVRWQLLAASLATVSVLSACGGGAGDDSAAAPTAAQTPAVHALLLTTEQRIAAARSAANGHPDCVAVQPFYWEVGDRNQKLGGEPVDPSNPRSPAFTERTQMAIASASKWVYGAYVVQRRGGNGNLSEDDVKYLSFRSGYRFMGPMSCETTNTVLECHTTGTNALHAREEGPFAYNGGHMQKHAAIDLDLGAMDKPALADEITRVLGMPGFRFGSPQPPGGIVTQPKVYAEFLRKVMRGELFMNQSLGKSSVCAYEAAPCNAISTPIPPEQHFSYSIGHWVETWTPTNASGQPDPADAAFSSAGAFGFYPWIEPTRNWYGLVARQDERTAGEQAGFASALCGRQIRKAWMSGVPYL